MKGFTLIELIMIIVVIGILSVIAVPRFMNMRENATAARDAQVLGALRSGTSIYYAQSASQGNAAYPQNITALLSTVKWDPPELVNQYTWVIYNNTTGGIVTP